MAASDRFSPEKRPAHPWSDREAVGLLGPFAASSLHKKNKKNRFYDFRDLIGLRTVKQLVEEGVPANRLRRALAALREKLVQVQAPLTELRILSDGKDVIVERHGGAGGTAVWPVCLEFRKRRALGEKVRVIAERDADEWLALALEYEAEKKTRTEAIDAYDRAFAP